MLLVCEDLDEACQDPEKAVLGLGRRKLGDLRLRSDHKLQFGNHVDQELSVLSHRLEDRGLEPVEIRTAAFQHLANQLLHGLHEGGIGHIPLKLVELARRIIGP